MRWPARGSGTSFAGTLVDMLTKNGCAAASANCETSTTARCGAKTNRAAADTAVSPAPTITDRRYPNRSITYEAGIVNAMYISM